MSDIVWEFMVWLPTRLVKALATLIHLGWCCMTATFEIFSVVPTLNPLAPSMLHMCTGWSLILCVPAGCARENAWDPFRLHVIKVSSGELNLIFLPSHAAGLLGSPWCQYHQDAAGQPGEGPSLGILSRNKMKNSSFPAIGIQFMIFLKDILSVECSSKE